MDNTLERVLLEMVVKLIEDDKQDPLVPGKILSEEAAFDIAVEMLQESLNYHTLKECKRVVGPIDY